MFLSLLRPFLLQERKSINCREDVDHRELTQKRKNRGTVTFFFLHLILSLLWNDETVQVRYGHIATLNEMKEQGDTDLTFKP